MSAARFRICGKVQGVWFRAATCEQARVLDLRGIVRNLGDGSVEVVAIGNDAALHDLELWLQSGPPLARVDIVQRESLDKVPEIEGFSTL